MSFIDTIRNKPHAEKVKIIWIVVAITAALLIVLWVVTSKIGDNNPLDPKVRNAAETIKRGFNDTRENLKK